MREKEPSETFTIKLKNGQEVKVTWHKGWDSVMDHLELRGPMTETGYKSDFISKDDGLPMYRARVIEHAAEVAQKCWDENPERDGNQPSLF